MTPRGWEESSIVGLSSTEDKEEVTEIVDRGCLDAWVPEIDADRNDDGDAVAVVAVVTAAAAVVVAAVPIAVDDDDDNELMGGK